MTFLSYTGLDFNNLEKLEINKSYNPEDEEKQGEESDDEKMFKETKVKLLRYLNKDYQM